MHTVQSSLLSPGINLTCVKTDKFKTGCLMINLICPLRSETAASAALYPRVLRRGTEQHPDMEKIAFALDELYGASIEPTVRKKGELHSTGFYADFPDDRYLPDSGDILEKTTSLLGEILLRPATDGDLLRSDYIEGEKKNLIDDIRAGINDKRSYATDRLFEEMCSGEAFGVNRLGSEKEAQRITPESLTRHYRELLANSNIEILFCGSTEPSRVETALRPALQDLPARIETKLPESEIILYPPANSPRRCTEALDVSQCKLAIGFRLGKAMSKAPDYPGMMVFNAVYGSGATSKLFRNVREKLALCYYASSVIDKHKGIMLVSSGIEFANYEVALDEILAQLENTKNGEISEWELLSAKRSVITSIKSAMDRPSGLLELYFDSSVSAVQYDPDKLCDEIEAVSLDRVVETASEIGTDTIYFLTGS